MRTLNQIIQETTHEYLDTIDAQNPPEPRIIEQELVNAVRQTLDAENAMRERNDRFAKPYTLSFSQIADIMVKLYPICRIAAAGENADTENDLLAIYQTSGRDKGIYVTSEEVFRGIARQYNYNLSKKHFEEAMLVIKDRVPRRERSDDPDLIAVNNGIFNYKTKELQPFTPDLIFISKSRVNYTPNPKNPVIQNEDGTYWDVESWMQELSDDPEKVTLFWEIIGAVIRPHVRWNKSAWFYADTGNNGKGTLCQLMRNVCGAGSYASIPLASFGERFMLEPLTRASAIIVDENDVGLFIDRAANLKAVITNDVIQLDRKHKIPITYQFFGFMVQCLNEFPRIKDKSDSFYRRQLFVPFEKSFTGRENRAIKNDYLHRKDVLEYVLHRVLHMDYYKLSEPQDCKLALEDYKEFNDPIRQFVQDIVPECVWDLLPFSFLYDLYKSWFKEVSPSGKILAYQNFITDILNVMSESEDWYSFGRRYQIRTGSYMDKPEPLILRYGLTTWMNTKYKGTQEDLKVAVPNKASKYRGFLRRTSYTEDRIKKNERKTEESSDE